MILCEPDRCQLPTATNLASQINRRFAWLSKTTLSLSISYTQYFSSSLYWAKTIVPRRGVRVYSAWINNNRIGKLGLGHQLLTSSLVIASCVRLRAGARIFGGREWISPGVGGISLDGPTDSRDVFSKAIYAGFPASPLSSELIPSVLFLISSSSRSPSQLFSLFTSAIGPRIGVALISLHLPVISTNMFSFLRHSKVRPVCCQPCGARIT